VIERSMLNSMLFRLKLCTQCTLVQGTGQVFMTDQSGPLGDFFGNRPKKTEMAELLRLMTDRYNYALSFYVQCCAHVYIHLLERNVYDVFRRRRRRVHYTFIRLLAVLPFKMRKVISFPMIHYHRYIIFR